MCFSSAVEALAGDFKPFEGPRPLVVLIETSPWLMVVGSDGPSFVLYENGEVVYQKMLNERECTHMAKQLSDKEFNELKSKIRTLSQVPKLKHRYELTQITDQPETLLFIDIGDSKLVTSIYGFNLVDDSPSKGLRNATKLPSQLRTLHSFISKLKFEGAHQWVPKYVEAMVWSYDYAPEESIHWPKEWPGLQSPTSFKRGDSYSIFLPGTELDKLSEFLKTRKEKGAVEIDNKKWSVSVRRTFPGEPIWRKAFYN
jgi:hypothetical protein